MTIFKCFIENNNRTYVLKLYLIIFLIYILNLSLINLKFKYIYFFYKKIILVKKWKREKGEKITNSKDSTLENIEKCQ